MERRNTIQKELVLNTVRKLACHATADEIYRAIFTEHPTVSRGTVYRNLNVLADEGRILKIEVPGEADRYDQTCTRHYHLRCMKCRRVFDVDMEPIPDIMGRIRDTHGMEIIDYDIGFKGLCAECRAGTKGL